ncbi:MAG TPA: hypothetical protein ENJ00_09810 [Phycisphaerales bacterium]|nr:hypothetical protein [Phycisphaerales bacterium]
MGGFYGIQSRPALKRRPNFADAGPMDWLSPTTVLTGLIIVSAVLAVLHGIAENIRHTVARYELAQEAKALQERYIAELQGRLNGEEVIELGEVDIVDE